MIRKDRDEAAGSAGTLSGLRPSSSAASQKRSHSGCSQTARPLTDDQAFGAVDLAIALGAGPVFGGVLDGTSAILFAFVQDLPVGLLALPMEPGHRPVTEEDLDEVVREATVGADITPFPLTPFSIRNTATRPAVIGFLAFSNRNISFGCCGLKNSEVPISSALLRCCGSEAPSGPR